MLKMVTMTGADDDTEQQALLDISGDFPFVEWGILASKSQMGSERFPSIEWAMELQELAVDNDQNHAPNLSLHLCGSWVRQLLMGQMSMQGVAFICFQRVQLNFHAENVACDAPKFWQALRGLPDRQFIFQIDGAGGNKHLEKIYCINDGEDYKVNAVPLFDISGGAGILPKEWPKPKYTLSGFTRSKFVYHGYAGGLGPHNLADELPKIMAAAGDCDIWIDMETHVRTGGNFDLDKVVKCLEIAAPYIDRRTGDLHDRRIS